MKHKRGFIAAVLFLVVFLGMYVIRDMNTEPAPYRVNRGIVFGTTYKIAYQSDADLQSEIQEEFRRFDLSLSPFNERSVISRINNNDSTVVADDWFITVFNKSKEVFEQSGGAFDPTVSPLINLWGFGFKKRADVTPERVDSLLPLVGMDKIVLKNGRITKADPRMTLDFSAIAKGFSSDVIGALLQKNGVKNYMVEVGGEVVTSGLNSKGLSWHIGINLPEDTAQVNSFQYKEVVCLSGKAMATSGNYRNFYYKDGKRIAHTIDPKSGYPIEHSLLSASVVADDCMTADAFATVFMVLGLERSLQLANGLPYIDAYFIYDKNGDEYGVAMTPGMRRHLEP